MTTRRLGPSLLRFRGDSHAFRFKFLNSDGTAFDLTGRTLTMTVDTLESPDDALTNEFSLAGVIFGPPTDGIADFTPTVGNMNLSPAVYFYDVQSDLSGTISTLAKGPITLVQDISK